MHRVVVVDDSPEFRRWFNALLEASDDFEIIGNANTGKEACRLVESEMPDLVITDVYMPDMDGLELARYVHSYFPKMKVILVSVHEDRVYKRLANEEGAVAFIPKAKLSLEALRQSLRGEE